MSVPLVLGALAMGFTLSVWVASRIALPRPGETIERRLARQEKTVRRQITAVGCAFTVIFVMVVWLQATSRHTNEATEIALAAARRNCLTQQQSHASAEKGLIADVRLARAQYQAAVDALLQIDERLEAEIPDTSALPVVVQDFVGLVLEQNEARNLADRERFRASLDRWATELATREGALDEHRTLRIASCPSAEVEDADMDQVTIRPTTT